MARALVDSMNLHDFRARADCQALSSHQMVLEIRSHGPTPTMDCHVFLPLRTWGKGSKNLRSTPNAQKQPDLQSFKKVKQFGVVEGAVGGLARIGLGYEEAL